MIEYKDGKQIITHRSGHIDIYNVTDIEQFKAHTVKGIVRLQAIETNLNTAIQSMKASLSVSPT